MNNTSDIIFKVTLDENNVPEKIEWSATDQAESGSTETKSISVALWDHIEKSTLRIDLWTKDMPVEDMKHFYVESLNGMAQSLLTATGDEKIAAEIRDLSERLAELEVKQNQSEIEQ